MDNLELRIRNRFPNFSKKVDEMRRIHRESFIGEILNCVEIRYHMLSKSNNMNPNKDGKMLGDLINKHCQNGGLR